MIVISKVTCNSVPRLQMNPTYTDNDWSKKGVKGYIEEVDWLSGAEGPLVNIIVNI